MTVGTGTHLLLQPEDVGGKLDVSFYAVVVSVKRSNVSVKPISVSPSRVVVVPAAVAAQRVVADDDATRTQAGTWLRKAVRFTVRGSTLYGQVVGYDGAAVMVSTREGEKRVEPTRLVGEVYPLAAIALGVRRWAHRTWPTTRLDELQEEILSRAISGQHGRPLQPAHLRELAAELDNLEGYQASWIDPATGLKRTVSLAYVLRYVFYSDGGAATPSGTEAALGNSFCEEPRPNLAGQSPTSEDDSLFDPLIDDDDDQDASGAEENGAAHAPATSPRAQGQSLSVGAKAPQKEARRQSSKQEANCTTLDEEIQFIELIRQHKPHLLEYFLSQHKAGPSKRCITPSEELETAPPPSKRSRTAFTPSKEQERIHRVVTAPSLVGKSSDGFLEFVLSHPTVSMAWHPGVLARVYDLQFGRGLSIMHFKRIGFLDKISNASSSASLCSDYSAPAPSPPSPNSWANLGAATRCFLDYTSHMCDSITCQVAGALNSFVMDLEKWEQLYTSDLPTVVLWIDSVLHDYRCAVVQDLNNATDTREGVGRRFSVQNPEVHSLLIAILNKRQSAPAIQPRAPRLTQLPANLAKHERKIPPEVVEKIPKRGEAEVCLHFLSKRGCRSRDPDRCNFKDRLHFWPDFIHQKVRQYIESSLGGMRSQPRME